jgi:hypothetical protein
MNSTNIAETSGSYSSHPIIMTATDTKRLCKTSGGASCCPSAWIDGIEATKRILKGRPTTVVVGISVNQAEHVMLP